MTSCRIVRYCIHGGDLARSCNRCEAEVGRMSRLIDVGEAKPWTATADTGRITFTPPADTPPKEVRMAETKGWEDITLGQVREAFPEGSLHVVHDHRGMALEVTEKDLRTAQYPIRTGYDGGAVIPDMPERPGAESVLELLGELTLERLGKGGSDAGG